MHDMGLKIVILNHFYTYEEVASLLDEETMLQFFQELEGELRAEIESTIGPIDKINFFPENPAAGIVKIKFLSAMHAEECIKKMDQRFFDGRIINAFYWDGKTDYRVFRETKEDE